MIYSVRFYANGSWKLATLLKPEDHSTEEIAYAFFRLGESRCLARLLGRTYQVVKAKDEFYSFTIEETK